MDESYDELIPDWCNEDLDIKCAEAVDEFEKKSRFACLSDTEMEKVLEDSHSKSTKRHTKWVIKLFEGEKNDLFSTHLQQQRFSKIFFAKTLNSFHRLAS